MKDEFSRFHPIVNIIFYIVVLGITMFQMQFGLVLISLFSAVVYYLCLKKSKGVKYLLVIIGIFLVSSFINPLFSHKGKTVLFYLFTGNPVTLESIIYGVMASAIICGMLIWLSTFHQVMGTQRILAVIGKIFPNVSLLISMILRFIPKYTKHQKKVAAYNKVGRQQSLAEKIKDGSKVFSITTTWALENSIETADAMKARGFGTGRRTSYSNYKIEIRDIVAIFWIIALASGVLLMLGKDNLYTYYYPFLDYKGSSATYILYGLLCLTPTIIYIREEVRWFRLKSKI